jgi:hypothetical protein
MFQVYGLPGRACLVGGIDRQDLLDGWKFFLEDLLKAKHPRFGNTFDRNDFMPFLELSLHLDQTGLGGHDGRGRASDVGGRFQEKLRRAYRRTISDLFVEVEGLTTDGASFVQS